MTFVSRLALLLAASVVTAVVATAVIAFGASERVSQEIERARVAHLLSAVKQNAEASLSIGLALDQISTLQNRIEREKAGDPSILAIEVFNPSGRAVYSTDVSVTGETVSADWVRRLSTPGTWQAVERGETVFGSHFENDLGVAGGIAVTVSDESHLNRIDRLAVDLILRAAPLALIAALVAAGAAIAFSYVVTRPFDHAARVLAGHEAVGADDPDLVRLAGQARAGWNAAEARIDRGLQQLGALDDAG